MGRGWGAVFIFMVGVSVLAADKKTVCSITLNSRNEIEAFKDNLNPNEFNFVELTELGSDTPRWLEEACDHKISCDVLVVSGHFGGRFFGDTSEKTIETETLEKLSCKSACSGIFSKPKEVFLFGCNTLASKDRDQRTPAQYVQVLMDHGSTYEHAQLASAFRYSALGDSFRDRMARIFSNTPIIAGFSSLSPLGKYVTPFLNNYLRATKDTYSAMLDNLRMGDTEKISPYFSGTSFVTISGAGLSFEEKNHQIPACFLNNNNFSLDSKFGWIESQMASDTVLSSIVPISVFLNEVFKNGVGLTPNQSAMLNRITSNEKAKNRLLFLFDNFVTGLLRIQVNILNFYLQVRWFNENEYKEKIEKLISVKLALASKLDTNWVDTVCSVNTDLDITLEDVPAQRWFEEETFRLLGCLRPRDLRIKEKFFNVVETSSSTEMRWMASANLFPLVTQEDLDRLVADLSHEQTNRQAAGRFSSIAENLAKSFRKLDVSKNIDQLIPLIENSQGYFEAYPLGKALANVKTLNHDDMEKLLDAYDSTSNPAFTEVIGLNISKYPDFIDKLLLMFKNSKMPKRQSLIWFIQSTGVQNPTVKEALASK